MKTYKYSFFSKLIYRYGNIPVTILLLIYLAISIIGLFSYWYYIFFTLINLSLLFLLNKYYTKTYRQFPFEISADNEKIICTNFLFSKRKIELRIEDIDKLTGGIFSGYPTRPVYIHDSRQNITIGLYANVGKFPELLKIILQNVKEDLYKDLVGKINELRKKK
ncbi:MAG: hypothetical protein NTZ27_11610 [Ignavibacteriales bacterium]|nr:hypothetical protein [Ignavibacteriales bacterium]